MVGRNKGVTYDARTGFEVKGTKLRQDGEKRGVWTTDVDEIHPQRFVRPPGPDGVGFRPGTPAPHGIPVDVRLDPIKLHRTVATSLQGGADVEVT